MHSCAGSLTWLPLPGLGRLTLQAALAVRGGKLAACQASFSNAGTCPCKGLLPSCCTIVQLRLLLLRTLPVKQPSCPCLLCRCRQAQHVLCSCHEREVGFHTASRPIGRPSTCAACVSCANGGTPSSSSAYAMSSSSAKEITELKQQAGPQARPAPAASCSLRHCTQAQLLLCIRAAVTCCAAAAAQRTAFLQP